MSNICGIFAQKSIHEVITSAKEYNSCNRWSYIRRWIILPLLGAAAIMSIYLLWIKKNPSEDKEMSLCDNLVYVGLAFMTLGMLTGAVWAKEAWGHYWSWDPKEIWAAVTWFSYLTYVHLRIGMPNKRKAALYILLLSFVFLQMCWWGINYLPAAQGNSVHTYNMN